MNEKKTLSIINIEADKKTNTPMFLDSVSAGFPSPATDYMENKLDLNEYLVKHHAATFIVKASGFSMIEAGIHSGDSTCTLPPYSLSEKIISDINKQTKKLAIALKVKGLMNIQFEIQNNNIFLLEVNPRSSRTVPFVAKSTGFETLVHV